MLFKQKNSTSIFGKNLMKKILDTIKGKARASKAMRLWTKLEKNLLHDINIWNNKNEKRYKKSER